MIPNEVGHLYNPDRDSINAKFGNRVGYINLWKGKAIRCDGITHANTNLIRSRGKMKLAFWSEVEPESLM